MLYQLDLKPIDAHVDLVKGWQGLAQSWVR